jgi:hypothetical protein
MNLRMTVLDREAALSEDAVVHLDEAPEDLGVVVVAVPLVQPMIPLRRLLDEGKSKVVAGVAQATIAEKVGPRRWEEGWPVRLLRRSGAIAERFSTEIALSFLPAQSHSNVEIFQSSPRHQSLCRAPLRCKEGVADCQIPSLYIIRKLSFKNSYCEGRTIPILSQDQSPPNPHLQHIAYSDT